MTADFLIYAVGGGTGHAVRGFVLQSALKTAGCSCEVLVRPENLESLPLSDQASLRPWSSGKLDHMRGSAETLLVDTFPDGWRNELSPSFLKSFRRRIFLARYRREVDWEAVSARYHSIVLPYEKLSDEWGTLPVVAKCSGFLLRSDAAQWRAAGNSLLVIDPEARCSLRFLEVLRRMAERCGRSFQYVQRFSGIFEAGKFLFVGAGYNTFYEVLRQRVDAKFLPVEKRYDDQLRRARRWGLQVESLPSLSAWLSSASGEILESPHFSGHSPDSVFS